MFVEVTGEKLVGKEAFLPPIMNRVKYGNCIVNVSFIPPSPITLTTSKNFSTRESFWCNYVCLWQNCLCALLTKTPHCSLLCFGINYAWLFVMNYLPQRCHKLSRARHNNYVAAFEKLSKRWNCPGL